MKFFAGLFFGLCLVAMLYLFLFVGANDSSGQVQFRVEPVSVPVEVPVLRLPQLQQPQQPGNQAAPQIQTQPVGVPPAPVGSAKEGETIKRPELTEEILTGMQEQHEEGTGRNR